MDKLHQIFKESYVSKLRMDLEAGNSIDKYSAESFEIDETQKRPLANIYCPVNLLEEMMQYTSPKDDVNAAITLYKAYETLSPLVASMESFWVYLTHTELFPYVQKRWMEDGYSAKNIQERWFYGSNGNTRNALANLWWSVRCSIDETADDKFELTRVFFQNATFRTRVLKVMLRTKNGLIGILRFLRDNPDVTAGNFEYRGRFIASYFNFLGAVKQLSYLDPSFFYEECVKLKPQILSI